MIKRFLFIWVLVLPLVLFAQTERDVRSIFRYHIDWGQNTKKMIMKVAVPLDIENRQEIYKISFSQMPDTIYETDGNRYAEYIFTQKPDSDIFMVAYERLLEADYETLKKAKRKTVISATELGRYLQNEKYLEKDAENIHKKALELKKKTVNKTVANICKFVHNNIEYEVVSTQDTIGAERTLKNRKGDCTEFSDLFVALCRADSIPARIVKGLTTFWGKNSTPSHSWAEVFLEGIGWVSVDPTHNDDFKIFDNKYLVLSRSRNDKVLGYGASFSYRYWTNQLMKPTVTQVLYFDNVRFKME